MAGRELTARFAVYQPGGNDPVDYIHHAQWRVQWVANKPGEGILDLELDKNAHGAAWLMKPCDIALELNVGPGGLFVEPRNSRFVHVAENYDLNARYGTTIKAQCPPVAWLLTKAVVHAILSLPPKRRPTRSARNLTVGHVFDQFALEAQNIGMCSTLDLRSSYSVTKDSANLSWANEVSLSVNVGDNLLDGLLNRLISAGWCEGWFDARKLKLYRPGHVNHEPGVTLLAGRDIGPAPREVDRASRANHGYVMGDDGVYKRVTHPTKPGETAWGDWEVAIQVSGVPPKDLAKHGQTQLASQYPGDKVGTTVELVMNPDGVLPFRDYQVWDLVDLRIKDGAIETYRVNDLTLSRTTGRISGIATLGHRKLTPEVKAAKAVKTLSVTSGVGTVAGSGQQVKLPTSTAQVYNLVSEGADPDGIEAGDDVFAAVLSTITDNIVEFGPNLHVIEVERGSTLTLTATQVIDVPVTVRGGGTIILPPTGPAFLIDTNAASGSSFEDVTFLNADPTAGLATALRISGVDAANRVKDIRIEDCYFDRCGIDGDPDTGPVISLRYSLDTVVRHCTFRYPTPAGIVLWSDNENALIEDCTFIEPWANASGYDACVHVYQNNNVATIRGNRHINRGEVTGKSHASQRGLYIASNTGTSINAPDNRWEGTTTQYSGGGLVRHTVFQPWDDYLEWLDRSSSPAAPTSQRTIMYAQGGLFRVRNPSTDVAFLTKPMVTLLEGSASGTIALTATHVDVTGTELTFSTTYPNARLNLTAVFDFSFDNTAGQEANHMLGTLQVDGTEQTRQAILRTTANARGTVSQTYAVTLASAGSHTVRLRAWSSRTAGSARTNTPHTGWTATLTDAPA